MVRMAMTPLWNAISKCEAFSLFPVEAMEELARVITVVNAW